MAAVDETRALLEAMTESLRGTHTEECKKPTGMKGNEMK